MNYYSYFEQCEIEGNVDFIFGGGNATFNNCKIYSLKANGKAWVCAPDHNKENNHGFIFNIRSSLIFVALSNRNDGNTVRGVFNTFWMK